MNNKTHKLIPELRFSEFVNKEEWISEPLNKTYRFLITNSFSRENLNYKDGLVKNIHYGDIHTKFSTLFDIQKERVPYINSNISIDRINQDNYCEEGDIVFADASEDIQDVGKSIEIINLNDEKLLSGLHTLLARQIEQKLIIGFGGYLFKSEFIRKQIQKEAQGTKVLSISATRISKINIYYPKSPIEQKKIVDCFASLDELITAHIDKLETLKTYKKGLMQNLFPQEGEKVPKLRFKKFEKDGNWEKKSLEKVADIVTGNTPSTNETQYYNGGKLFVSPADINEYRYLTQTRTRLSDLGFSRTRKIKENSVLFVCIGSTIGKIVQTKVECATNQQINSLTCFENYSDDFLYSVLEHHASKIADLAGNHAVPIINKSTFSAIELNFPPTFEEQQKVAVTFSSLDELISEQANKIENLKLHKKGLMQGLFPKVKN
ncbi:restriction endonuclease subunit S [Flavobacterium sp. ALJ2]|uniref:restriction endonuclease subunit S n=1 Tax=Flavobacterium sp. ALJ2 TaxID=2786960 RepID=UPI00189F6A72|nr:restriction endonuclease subunit S [Flavobacterium sp. ALJ2]MBF7092107.1 restriction endonuclease subunit S [Flavobacterium sp. ALJ2]